MYKVIAVLLVFGAAVMCAPDRTSDSIIDEVFGSTSTATTSLQASSTTSIGGEQCTLKGNKGRCVAYYLCPEPDSTTIDIRVPEEEECQNYLQVCCLKPVDEKDLKDSK